METQRFAARRFLAGRTGAVAGAAGAVGSIPVPFKGDGHEIAWCPQKKMALTCLTHPVLKENALGESFVSGPIYKAT